MFDDEGNPLYKMVDCYIDPAIPMNWNKYGSFHEFPLKPLTALEGRTLRIYYALFCLILRQRQKIPSL
jgi:hypothetical protein